MLLLARGDGDTDSIRGTEQNKKEVQYVFPR